LSMGSFLFQPFDAFACLRSKSKNPFVKKLIYIVFVIILFSCSDNDGGTKKIVSRDYPQHWKLTRMTGNIPNSQTTGNNMAWQEIYVFNADNTFSKTRNQKGILYNATGTYAYVTLGNENQVSLLFETGKELAGSCFSDGGEALRFLDDKLVATWNICDGPGLEYELCESCTLQ
jgi:hypothetical protein